MGSWFSEEDYGKKDSNHEYIKSTTSYSDRLETGEYKQYYFRKCKRCGHVQIGQSWIGYESHGINWFDAETFTIMKTEKPINWQWRINHAEY